MDRFVERTVVQKPTPHGSKGEEDKGKDKDKDKENGNDGDGTRGSAKAVDGAPSKSGDGPALSGKWKARRSHDCLGRGRARIDA